MKKKVQIILVVIFTYSLSANSITKKDSITTLLHLVLKDKEKYEEVKKKKIQDIKNLLIEDLSPEYKYEIYTKLYNEYEKYISDSALYYIQENVRIATQLKQKELQYESLFSLATSYSTKGMYIESKNILENIDIQELSQNLLIAYYNSYCKFYSHYGQSNGNDEYYRKSEDYRDSLLMILPKESLKYKIEYATKLVYSKNVDIHETEEYLLALLNKLSDSDLEKAMVSYLLSEVYRISEKNSEMQEMYLMMSTITDIKNCIKDNASIQNLALVYYTRRDINMAYQFMQEAVNNTVFCNTRYRAVEASASYPIINSLYVEQKQKQQKDLLIFLLSITILTIFLIIGIIYTYCQVKRLAKIRKELYSTNIKLNKLNIDLEGAIDSLKDANHIKEEYITQFFAICSNYIDKFSDYRKSINKLILNNQIDDLFKFIKSNKIIEEEIEELYYTFDTVFINLYPTFIEEFNALLLPEGRIYPKQGELLNTELRIFALIRLGIKDSVKIADFLRYSLRTVYNYRTKVRNKAIGKREEFESLVEKINCNISYKND